MTQGGVWPKARRVLLAAAAVVAAFPAQAKVTVSDVPLFYRVVDAAAGTPTAAVLQRDYLEAGSRGLRDFVPGRIGSTENLARLIASHPEIFKCQEVRTGPSCARETHPNIDQPAQEAASLTAPNVTVVIGAANSGGTATPQGGVILGLEVTCQNLAHSTYLWTNVWQRSLRMKLSILNSITIGPTQCCRHR